MCHADQTEYYFVRSKKLLKCFKQGNNVLELCHGKISGRNGLGQGGKAGLGDVWSDLGEG